jgi:hypothetical protein
MILSDEQIEQTLRDLKVDVEALTGKCAQQGIQISRLERSLAALTDQHQHLVDAVVRSGTVHIAPEDDSNWVDPHARQVASPLDHSNVGESQPHYTGGDQTALKHGIPQGIPAGAVGSKGDRIMSKRHGTHWEASSDERARLHEAQRERDRLLNEKMKRERAKASKQTCAGRADAVAAVNAALKQELGS